MADPAALWKANYQINTDERGFHFGVHIFDTDEDVVRTKANDIGARIKALMPKSAEVFYASISKFDSPRDGRFLHLAVGPGSFVEDEGPPELSDYDAARTCLNIRMETSTGGSSTLKFAPIPDSIVYGGRVATSITPVIGVPVADPAAAGAGADWFAEMTNFMKAITKNCIHVKEDIPVGGDIPTVSYKNAFAMRVSVKKGGRVFI